VASDASFQQAMPALDHIKIYLPVIRHGKERTQMCTGLLLLLTKESIEINIRQGAPHRPFFL
jgi:hypothetical protein